MFVLNELWIGGDGVLLCNGFFCAIFSSLSARHSQLEFCGNDSPRVSCTRTHTPFDELVSAYHVNRVQKKNCKRRATTTTTTTTTIVIIIDDNDGVDVAFALFKIQIQTDKISKCVCLCVLLFFLRLVKHRVLSLALFSLLLKMTLYDGIRGPPLLGTTIGW